MVACVGVLKERFDWTESDADRGMVAVYVVDACAGKEHEARMLCGVKTSGISSTAHTLFA